MIQEIENGDGLVQVVSSHQVEGQSVLGFRLIGVYQEGSYAPCSEDVPDPNGSYAGAMISVTKYIPTSETYFIMRKDEESALEDMQASVDFARKETKEAKDAFTEKEEEAKGYQEQLEQQKRTISRQGLDLQSCQEGQTSLRESANKMERDLGKIRESLGTKQFNEILGVEK